MTIESEKYDLFETALNQQYPKMFAKPYGGVAVSEGWWLIIEKLCANIQSHTDWKNNTRELLLKDNPYNQTIPQEVQQVVVSQIKEKFGGLRFYYTGGDEQVSGMVSMAEAWASVACEQCGAPGARRSGGWMQTLCDTHEAERQLRLKKHD